MAEEDEGAPYRSPKPHRMPNMPSVGHEQCSSITEGNGRGEGLDRTEETEGGGWGSIGPQQFRRVASSAEPQG